MATDPSSILDLLSKVGVVPPQDGGGSPAQPTGSQVLDSAQADDPSTQDQIQPTDESDDSSPVSSSPGQVPDEHQRAFKDLLESIRTSERDIRFRQIKSLKRNELFWLGQFNIFWNDGVGDWQSIQEGVKAISSDEMNIDPTLYDRAKVNVYRAYGESVIGAVANGVPSIRYFPSNPNNSTDIRTSEAYSTIGTKIEEENDAEGLVRRGMTLLWNQGFIGCYNFSHFDSRYGTSQQKIFGERGYTNNTSTCSTCGEVLSDEFIPEMDQESSTQQEILQRALEGSSLGQNDQQDQTQECPNCGPTQPVQTSEQFQAPYVKGETEVNKCRQILEFYGPLNIQIPYWARLPKDIGWVILSVEAHYAQMRDLYSDVICNDGTPLSEKIQPGPASVVDDTYERWARTNYDYFSTATQLVTVQRVWFKPWMFHALKDDDLIEEMKTAYPHGVYVVFINDIFAEAYQEDLDEHWTFTINPLEERVNASPFGKFLVPVQEMINELIFLTMQTIQYGVPVTFFDAMKLDGEAFKQTSVSPGNMYPMTRASGESLSNNITSTELAHLSSEVPAFMKSLEYYAQLVSGAFPQIFGGATNNRTLGQDDNARNQALQRLGTAWKMINEFWASVMSKAVKNYANDMVEDETYVKQLGTSQVAVEIKREELTGEIGEVRPETSEQFPISWSQQRDQWFNMLQNNPQIASLLLLPQNVALMKKVIGVDELYLPGDDDRTKQLSEITDLLQGVPTPAIDPTTGQQQVDQTGQPVFQSSVPIEPMLDDDATHIAVAQGFCNSDVGQMMKRINPNGYQNIILHVQAHFQNKQQRDMQMLQLQLQAKVMGIQSDIQAGATEAVTIKEQGQVGQ